MIKAIFCVAICAFSTLISYEMYSKVQRRAKSADDMRYIVERMIVLLRFGHYDVFQICEAVLSECDVDHRCDFTSQWDDICNEFDSDKDDRALFYEVGRILGSADAKSQIEELLFIRDELMRSYDKKRSVLEKKRRLYLSIGGFGGLMLCILLI